MKRTHRTIDPGAWPRPLWATALLALALVSLAVARTPEPGVRVERVTLTSSRGLEVPALRVEPASGGVRGTALLAHGITASKEVMFRQAEALALVGFRCLAIDLPSHGESAAALERHAVLDSYAAGAQALSATSRVDVLVGHSFGAYNGARALDEDALAARLFVVVGARAPVGSGDGTRVLFVSGALEELHRPDEVRRHAARHGGDVLIVPGVDHALEPFHPGVVNAVVRAACDLVGGEPVGTRAWIRRLVGCVFLLACAVAAVRFLPRGGAETGLVAGGLVMAAAVASLHGTSAYLAPTLERALAVGLFGLAAWGASAWLARVLARFPRLQGRTALASQLTWLAVNGLVCAGLAAVGARFARFGVLVGGGVSLLLLAAIAFAWFVRRHTGREASAHTAFAVVVGYVEGAWVGSLLF